MSCVESRPKAHDRLSARYEHARRALLAESRAHDPAVKWFARHRGKGCATCPLTQAGFVRIVSNPAFSRDAVTPRDAVHVLTVNVGAEDHSFWRDEFPFAETVAFAGCGWSGINK